MKAIILAAGLGTRLKPLTDETPKPMIEVGGKPILEHIVDNLTHYDVTQIFVNLHYRPEVIAKYFGPKLIYLYEPQLYGEDGTIANFKRIIGNEPFVLANGDTISNINLDKMFSYHFRYGNQCTKFMVNGRYAGTKVFSLGIDFAPNYTQEDAYYFDCGTHEKLEKARKFFEG